MPRRSFIALSDAIAGAATLSDLARVVTNVDDAEVPPLERRALDRLARVRAELIRRDLGGSDTSPATMPHPLSAESAGPIGLTPDAAPSAAAIFETSPTDLPASRTT